MNLANSGALLTPGYACINPPPPPPSTRVRLVYEANTSVPFGANVSYVCEDGLHFEEDYAMTDFNLTCNPDGSWSAAPGSTGASFQSPKCCIRRPLKHVLMGQAVRENFSQPTS